MTVSTLAIYHCYTKNLSDAYNIYNVKLEKLTANKKITQASDGPAEISDALACRHQVAMIDSYKNTRHMIYSDLVSQDAILSNMAEELGGEIQSKIIAARNGTTGDLSILAREIKKSRDVLISLVNNKNNSGNYIFSGMKKNTETFNAKGEYKGGTITIKQMINQSCEMQTNYLGKKIFVMENKKPFFNQLDALIDCLMKSAAENVATNDGISETSGVGSSEGVARQTGAEHADENLAKEKIISETDDYLKYCLDEISKIQADIGISLNQLQSCDDIESLRRINLENSYQQAIGSDDEAGVKLKVDCYIAEMALNKSIKLMESVNRMSIFNQ